MRGGIQVAICVFFLFIVPGMVGEVSEVELSGFRSALVLGAIVLVVMSLLGVAKIVVGVLDFMGRTDVHGRVMSLQDRRLGDVLPGFVQNMVVNSSLLRGSNVGRDARRYRTELVLNTPDGVKQWTLRGRGRRQTMLTVGQDVTISVTPIAGHVSNIRGMTR